VVHAPFDGSVGDFVEAFTKVKEGDGTLLDNVFIYGHDRPRLCARPLARRHADVHRRRRRRQGEDRSAHRGTKSNQTNKEVGEILA
jgi:hypothetical protein